MTLSFIILAQSVTGAVITIVALLLVAVVIGYLTAWFYSKSIYTPVIKGLQADKEELTRTVASLKQDIGRLNTNIDELNGRIKNLEQESKEKDNAIRNLKEESAEKDKKIEELSRTEK